MGIISRLWPGTYRDVVLNGLLASPLLPPQLRWRALRAYGMDIEPCHISPRVWFGSSRMTIGAGTFINYRCMFNTTARVSVGANCNIAMGVTFVTTSHEVGDSTRRAGAATAKPIVIGAGTWIGANATVLQGVTIGAGTIIAAGAVVAADCEPGALYAGVPARKIKDLDKATGMIKA